MRSLVLLAACLGGACQAHRSVPAVENAARNSTTHDASVGTRLESPYPPPVIAFEKFTTKRTASGETCRDAVFRITNVSQEPVCYFGHSSFPFFGVADLHAGAWKDRGVGYCGTGAGCHAIMPGKSADFQVWVEKDIDAMRVRVDFSSTREWSETITVWSEAVSLAGR